MYVWVCLFVWVCVCLCELVWLTWLEFGYSSCIAITLFRNLQFHRSLIITWEYKHSNGLVFSQTITAETPWMEDQFIMLLFTNLVWRTPAWSSHSKTCLWKVSWLGCWCQLLLLQSAHREGRNHKFYWRGRGGGGPKGRKQSFPDIVSWTNYTTRLWHPFPACESLPRIARITRM